MSQLRALPLLNPCSSSAAALAARAAEDGAPSTIAIRRRSPRVAEAMRLKPDAQMKPVFMPSAPGYSSSSLLKFVMMRRPNLIDGMCQ